MRRLFPWRTCPKCVLKAAVRLWDGDEIMGSWPLGIGVLWMGDPPRQRACLGRM